MRKLTYKKIDAFASSASAGNPAGVIYLNTFDELSGEEMLQIAKEQKGFVSEVGFIWEEKDGSFGLRYYSSEREVEFCGHATVAILYDLIASRPELLGKESVRIHTKNDTLTVYNHIADENAVFITAPKPKTRDTRVQAGDIANALGADESMIDTGNDIAVINAGLETLIVPITDLDAILSIEPDLETLKRFCTDSGIDIVILFTSQTVGMHNRYRTRVFAATFGYLEDPATGSGNSALGYYLLNRHLWDGSIMSIEQNGEREKYNTVKLTTQSGNVLFGGGAVVKIEGYYHLLSSVSKEKSV